MSNEDEYDHLPTHRHDDPYENVDVDRLPEWWSTAIEEFSTHDIPTYTPPRFDDGVIVPPVIERLETRYGVSIKLMGVGVRYGDAWGLYIDGERVSTLDRERTSDAYTRYAVTSTQFERLVAEAVEPNGRSPIDSGSDR